MSEWAVGWLLLGVAALVFGGGVALRWYVGRASETSRAAVLAFAVRTSVVGRFVFGPLDHWSSGNRSPRTVLDGEELDQLIVMPAIIVGAGLLLVAVLLLFIELVNR